MTRRYLVVFENGLAKPRAANLTGFVPDVPGCWSTGATLEELRANLHTALRVHLARLATSGQPIPEPIMGMDDVPAGCTGEWMVVKEPAIKAASFRKTAKRSSSRESEWRVFLKSSSDFLRGRFRFI